MEMQKISNCIHNDDAVEAGIPPEGETFLQHKDDGLNRPQFTDGELVPISSSLWTRGRVHPEQVTSHSQGNTQDKQLFTHKGNFKETNKPNGHVYGLLEEAGLPGENPRMHGENIQTPCSKDPWLGVEPNPFLLQVNNATNCTTVQPAYWYPNI
ncbi:hypothetical protein CHARACLAT_025442 [Characodon lateralis]|uniref:Prolactin receptor n=1 Tax=Characodon lateralis TaxID=208331 RepID=A0ABU7D9W9_9TELE|nr:hypothetical protein [Characodon lateralis]